METKRKIVKKHAATIHCSNSLSLLQRKISNALLFHAYPELMEKEEHEITILTLCRILGVTTNNHAALKDALRALVSTVLEWNVINDKSLTEDWTATTILASVQLKEGVCCYAYSPLMRRLLHSPSVYGQINLLVQSRFKSAYGLALYENCSRYRNLKSTKAFTLEEFRKLMGVQPSEYKLFRDFKRRVLDKAVDEVNTNSDMIIIPEVNRIGRKVISIKFSLKEKPPMPRYATSNDEEEKSSSHEHNIVKHRLLHDLKLPQSVAKQLLADYEPSYILEKIDFVLTSPIFLKGEVKDIAAYTLSAIKNNYQNKKSSQISIDKEYQQIDLQKDEIENEKSTMETLRRDYSKYVSTRFFDYMNSLKQEVFEQLINHWLAHLSSLNNFNANRIKRMYKESVFKHPSTYTDFMRFIKSHFSEHYPKVLSLDEFIETHNHAESVES